MKLLVIFLAIKLVFCTQYAIDVNEYHEPLTNFDIISKTVKYCIYMNNKTLDVNYLTGTWYKIYKFARRFTGLSNEYCGTTNFTLPTKEDLDAYKAKYNLQNESFTFDDASVLCSQEYGEGMPLKGIVVGNKAAKYYFLDPKSPIRLMAMYSVLTYKIVNDDYMIHYECEMRGHIKYLLSRKKDQTDAELENVIKPLYELEDMDSQRYCYNRKVVSTTPYF